jgi:tetratricopeptide (TPR) repeat protein
MNGDYEEAIKKYHDYIELEPDNYVALNNLGANYENINNFIEALKYYNLSIDKNQRYALSRRNRGSLLNNNGELDKAIIDLKISLEIEPDDAQGLNSLGVAYLRKKEYKMAIDYFDKALHLMPESALFIVNKKLAMKALG